MPDMEDMDSEDKLISELISELKDMDEQEARDMQEQIAYWKAFRLAYSQLKCLPRDLVQSIIDEEDD
jgi:3-methyladenine DNA glycosylase AlkD